MAAQPSGVSTTPPSLVSSANLLRVHSNSSSRSLMKKLNKTGPSTDPWGTPLVTGLERRLKAAQLGQYQAGLHLVLCSQDCSVLYQQAHHFICRSKPKVPKCQPKYICFQFLLFWMVNEKRLLGIEDSVIHSFLLLEPSTFGLD